MIADLRVLPAYWERLGAQPAAIEVLVRRDDHRPYLAYLEHRMSDASHADRLGRVALTRALVASIKHGGYDPERWRTDPRAADWAGRGFGPITVTGAGDLVWPRDGSHRACILRALDQPVPATVFAP